MDHLSKNIPFRTKYDFPQNDRFIRIYIPINDRDTIVFYWTKEYFEKDPNRCSTHVRHQFCGGEITFYDIEKYKLLKCTSCGLKKEFPVNLHTVNDFKRYFRGENIREKEIDRSELIDLEE